MLCRGAQDRQAIVKSSEKMWSTGAGNGKPLQYSCHKNPMNSIKRQKTHNIIGVINYMKQNQTKMKKISNYSWKFQHSSFIYRTSRHKNKDLTCCLYRLYIYRTLHSTTAGYIFFSTAYKIFITIDHKISPCKFKGLKIYYLTTIEFS